MIILAWDDCLNVQTCLGCLYELINDYELDIHEWELLVLYEKAVNLGQKLYIYECVFEPKNPTATKKYLL